MHYEHTSSVCFVISAAVEIWISSATDLSFPELVDKQGLVSLPVEGGRGDRLLGSEVVSFF